MKSRNSSRSNSCKRQNPRVYHLHKSDKNAKKYCIEFENKKIYFGAPGYEDFTTHKDVDRRDAYDKRHKDKEHWKDPTTAGFWAKWILWSEPTIRGSIKTAERRFKIKIVLHR